MNRTLCSLMLLLSIMPLAYCSAEENEIFRSRPEDSSHRRVIRQQDLPFTIKHSGEYQVEGNLHFKGAGAAITVRTDNVEIDLESFDIALTNPAATGILVRNHCGPISNIVIKNGSITNTAENQVTHSAAEGLKISQQTGSGISLINAQKVTIKALATDGSFNGINVQGSSDVRFLNAAFSSAVDAGVVVSGSACVSFANSSFMNNGYGILFTNEQGPNQDGKVIDCCFSNSAAQALLALQVNGLIIERSAFTNTGTANTANLVQLGGFLTDQVVQNALVKKSTFSNISATGSSLEGLAIVQGQNFIVDGNVFTNNNVGQDLVCNDFSGIHVAGGGLSVPVAGFVLRNNVVQGPAIDGIYPDMGAKNGLIEGNLTSQVLKDGILLDATAFTTVRNNTSTDNGRNGIGLAQTSSSCAVLKNVASGNASDGVFISGAQSFPTPCTAVFAASFNNTAQDNATFSNGGFGLNDQASQERSFSGTAVNKDFNNSAFNNTAGNYNGFFPPPTTLVAPGVAAVAGQNITA